MKSFKDLKVGDKIYKASKKFPYQGVLEKEIKVIKTFRYRIKFEFEKGSIFIPVIKIGTSAYGPPYDSYIVSTTKEELLKRLESHIISYIIKTEKTLEHLEKEKIELETRLDISNRLLVST